MKRRRFALGLLGIAGTAGLGSCKRGVKPPAAPVDALSLDGKLTNRYVQAETPVEVLARLRIAARPLVAQGRQPVNLGLVIDTSGSMDGGPIEAARAAAGEMVEALEPGDRITVVTFNSRTEVVVKPTVLAADGAKAVVAAIDAIQARGTTDLASGLGKGLASVRQFATPTGVNRIVLLSDGVPNDATAIPGIAAQARSSGITITALGLGLEYDETLLSTLAQASGGSFHFLENETKIAAVFRSEVLRLRRVVARAMTLNLVTGPDVVVQEIVGVGRYGTRQHVSVGLGDLSEDEERELVLRLSVSAHQDGANVELVDAMLGYADPGSGDAGVEQTVYLAARATADADQVAAGQDPAAQLAVERAIAAARTLEAVAAVRDDDPAGAQAILDAAAPAARAAADRFGDAALDSQASQMNDLGRELGTGQSRGGGNRKRRAKAVRKAHGSAMDNFQSRTIK